MLIHSHSPDVAKNGSLIIKCKLLLFFSRQLIVILDARSSCFFFSFFFFFFFFLICRQRVVHDDDDAVDVVIVADGIDIVEHVHFELIHFRHDKRRMTCVYFFHFVFQVNSLYLLRSVNSSIHHSLSKAKAKEN